MSEKKQCPLCKDYGVQSELEEVWYDDGKRKLYRCNNPDFHHEMCDHILNATYDDINNFACNSCYADRIDNCQCMDCEVFCGECNSFIDISCGEVDGIIVNNEDKKKLEAVS